MKPKISTPIWLLKTGLHPERAWRGAFTGVRSRLLVWYFLLSLCITLSSVWATFKIFCALEEQQASARLQREIDVLQQEMAQTGAALTPATAIATLQNFTQTQVNAPNEYLFLVWNGQVHAAQTAPLPPLLRSNAALIQAWAESTPANVPFVREDYFIRVVEPVAINGQTGAIVGVYDATLRYEMGETTLALVVQVTIAMLILFMAIAWITAGRLLAPLRQLKETAQMITDTDLTQRMPVRGNDEIAELTLTFNQMLDRLQSAFTSQQDFIKDVSHELRTPITIIQGHLELLEDDPVERAATVALVRDELKRMNRFVSDLLLLMRAERPNFLKLGVVDLAPFTQELLAKAKGLAPRNWQLDAMGTGELVGDRQRLTQVIMNLAQNATQYTQPGDTIAIGSALHPDTIQVWVRDTGEGIAPADQDRIFNRFARGANSERRSDGAGLGLAIVQALVKAHHGSVAVVSHLGVGTTFTITLPRQPEPTPVAARPLPLRSVTPTPALPQFLPSEKAP